MGLRSSKSTINENCKHYHICIIIISNAIIYIYNLYIIYIDVLPEKKGALFELKENSENLTETLDFKYIEKEQISPDTFIYSYEIPKELPLGLNLGHHIAIE